MLVGIQSTAKRNIHACSLALFQLEYCIVTVTLCSLNFKDPNITYNSPLRIKLIQCHLAVFEEGCGGFLSLFDVYAGACLCSFLLIFAFAQNDCNKTIFAYSLTYHFLFILVLFLILSLGAVETMQLCRC